MLASGTAMPPLPAAASMAAAAAAAAATAAATAAAAAAAAPSPAATQPTNPSDVAAAAVSSPAPAPGRRSFSAFSVPAASFSPVPRLPQPTSALTSTLPTCGNCIASSAQLVNGGSSVGSNCAAATANGGGGGRKVSTSDIQLVQNLIERCMQMYMPLKEVISTLQSQAKIEPGFTQLVWQKLEEQNAEFFKAYYLRLKIKDQTVMFNYLLEQQFNMVTKLQMSWLQALPMMQPGMAAAAAAAAAAVTRPPGMPPALLPGTAMTGVATPVSSLMTSLTATAPMMGLSGARSFPYGLGVAPGGMMMASPAAAAAVAAAMQPSMVAMAAATAAGQAASMAATGQAMAAATSAGFGVQAPPPFGVLPGSAAMMGLPAMMQATGAMPFASRFGAPQQTAAAAETNPEEAFASLMPGSTAVAALPMNDSGGMAAQLAAMQVAMGASMAGFQQQPQSHQQQQREQQVAVADAGGFPITADLMALSDNALDGASMGELGMLAGSDQDLMRSLGFTTADVSGGGGAIAGGCFHLSLNMSALDTSSGGMTGEIDPTAVTNSSAMDLTSGGGVGLPSSVASTGDLTNLDLAKNFSFSDLSTMGMCVGMAPLAFCDLGQNPGDGDGDPMLLGGVGSDGVSIGGLVEDVASGGGGLVDFDMDKHQVHLGDFEGLGFALESGK